MTEEKYMSRALKLALKGQSHTNPNPLVGAILVKNNKVIGEGFHEKFGKAHAEINAINQAGKEAKDSTLFVNLEPCYRTGNTPPCTDAIIKAGISKVVFASKDPRQKSSAKILENARIEVSDGTLKQEADFLNRKFLYFANTNLPYITIKFAASLDGKLATKTYDSKWITNEKARKYSRLLRAENQAILVGSNTVTEDNPHLGTKQKHKQDPLRIILDSALKTSIDSKVYRDSNAIVVASNKASNNKIKEFQNRNINVHKLNKDKIEVKDLLQYLAKQKIISVLVEGGGEVIGSFIDNKAANEIYAFYAPIIIGGKGPSITGAGIEKVKDALKIKSQEFKKFDDNLMIHGLL